MTIIVFGLIVSVTVLITAAIVRAPLIDDLDAAVSEAAKAQSLADEAVAQRDMYADQSAGLEMLLAASEASRTAEASVAATTILNLTDALNYAGYSVTIHEDGTVECDKEQGTSSSATSRSATSSSVRRDLGGVERWRTLVAEYFNAAYVDDALSVMAGESGGDPGATNGQHRGLFQIASTVHADKIAEKAKAWGMDADLYDAEFNIRFAAYMSNYGRNWSSWEAQP